MKHVATYFDAQDLEVAKAALRQFGIPYELRQTGDELPATEIFVPPEHYDRSCELTEQLDQFLADKAASAHRPKICPRCGGSDLRRCEDVDLSKSLTGITSIYQCGQCGHLKPE